MIVMKFGGSSVGTADAISQVAGIVARSRDAQPVLVVSALQGVTDALLGMARTAVAGRLEEALANLRAIEERHAAVVRDLLGTGGDAAECGADVAVLVGELRQAVLGIAALRELSSRSLDLIVSFGERLSAPIVSAALRKDGLASRPVDARAIVETDDRFTSAEVDLARTEEKARHILLPLVGEGIVPVITGFIGATRDGITTTIGRGGSDFSATLIGAAIGAEEVWIWKEVDGVLSADPGVVGDASLLASVSYDEAAEMSYFGAKVLHPKAMIPAVLRRVPVRLRNTFHPDRPGTVIGERSDPAPAGVKVVTAIKKLAVVTVEGKGMSGIAGFAAQVFDVAGRHRISILMFSQSSSEQNICLVTEAKDGRALAEALGKELRDAVRTHTVDRITVEDGLAAVAVVGEGMRGAPGIAARVFGAVAEQGISVLAIAQGSSERNISFVIKEDRADAAVRAVHKAFRLHELVPAAARL